jgi:hypothetical protein
MAEMPAFALGWRGRGGKKVGCAVYLYNVNVNVTSVYIAEWMWTEAPSCMHTRFTPRSDVSKCVFPWRDGKRKRGFLQEC